MKKYLRFTSLLLVLLLTAMCITTAFAVSLYTDGDYTYVDVDSDRVALYNYSGDSDTLVIPAYFSNRGVSQIYDYAFEENNSFTKIDFSQNLGQLNIIGTKSFSECTSLTGTLSFPASLRNLGYASFQGCTGLESLYINLGIREIPEQCFNRCSGLYTVYLPSELESIDRLAFGNCSSLETIYIPISVTYISPYAFTNSNPTMYVYNNSYAQRFAIDHDMRYIVIDPPQQPTEPVPTEDHTETPTQLDPTEVPTEIEPTIVPTEEPTQANGYYLGDVNGDSVVDIIDATLIQRYCAKLLINVEYEIIHGDVNENNSVDDIDATLIKRFLASIEVYYPIGEWKSS